MIFHWRSTNDNLFSLHFYTVFSRVTQDILQNKCHRWIKCKRKRNQKALQDDGPARTAEEKHICSRQKRDKKLRTGEKLLREMAAIERTKEVSDLFAIASFRGFPFTRDHGSSRVWSRAWPLPLPLVLLLLVTLEVDLFCFPIVTGSIYLPRVMSKWDGAMMERDVKLIILTFVGNTNNDHGLYVMLSSFIFLNNPCISHYKLQKVNHTLVDVLC